MRYLTNDEADSDDWTGFEHIFSRAIECDPFEQLQIPGSRDNRATVSPFTCNRSGGIQDTTI